MQTSGQIRVLNQEAGTIAMAISGATAICASSRLATMPTLHIIEQSSLHLFRSGPMKPFSTMYVNPMHFGWGNVPDVNKLNPIHLNGSPDYSVTRTVFKKVDSKMRRVEVDN